VTGSFIGLLVGVVLGARHALEPDHLAAVSVLSAEAPGPRRGALLGAVWGLGHAAALLATGLVVAAMAREIPPGVADVFELAVAIMLVVLGGRAIRRATREGRIGMTAVHAHGAGAHRHAGPDAHVHVARRTLALRPLIVGLVHGLAGSGALTALVLVKLPSSSMRLTYIALFGVGSIIGMSALSGLAGWPLARLGRRPELSRLLFGAAGAVSALLGLFWGWSSVARLLA
jgi:hypothetical protein